MRARAVIGASFGDEGKGLTVDWLCRKEGAGVVVRYNGSSQAGHTVVTPKGERHVFSHFGSGSFVGVPTFLSRFFVCNPILFVKEVARLGFMPTVTADPDCLVTTFADMLANQRAENERGADRHGSCGVGVFATLRRSRMVLIRMRDLWGPAAALRQKVVEACGYHFPAALPDEQVLAAFEADCRALAECVQPGALTAYDDPVFEGAQGLLLDQNRAEFYPHLTPSNTGMQNVRQLCHEARLSEPVAYYVSRTYLTRHGAGPLPGEDVTLRYDDDTNVDHEFQGRLRFAPLDSGLRMRCAQDAAGASHCLVVTHCDQRDPPRAARGALLYAYGPTADDVHLAATRIRHA